MPKLAHKIAAASLGLYLMGAPLPDTVNSVRKAAFTEIMPLSENAFAGETSNQQSKKAAPEEARDILKVAASARKMIELKRKHIPDSLLKGPVVYVDLTSRYLYIFDSKLSPLSKPVPVGIGSGGIGTEPESYKTPAGVFSGQFEVSKCEGCTLRIISGMPMITSAAIWMHGLETENSNSFKRGIGIHAFPGEWLAKGRGNNSWGCIVTTDEDMWKIVQLLAARTNQRILVLSDPE